MPKCTKGHENQCRIARGTTCNCACLGVNHGSAWRLLHEAVSEAEQHRARIRRGTPT